MNRLITLTRYLLQEMRARKLRSFLALFGIMWGTISVVMLLALGHGFSQYNRQSLLSVSQGVLQIAMGASSIPYQGLPPHRMLAIKTKDIMKLKKTVPGIKLLSPDLMHQGVMMINHHKTTVAIKGFNQDAQAIKNLTMTTGSRFIDKLDLAERKNVVILSQDLKAKYFPNIANPVGRFIYFQGLPLKIIGVVKKQHNTGKWHDNRVYLPYTTFIKLLGNVNISSFLILPNDLSQTQTVTQSIKQVLAHQFHFSARDPTAIRVFDTMKFFQFFTLFFYAIETFLGFCGSMTLAVGAVGVANIMYLIVTERRYEIGLRLAVGAKRRDIMLQTLLESSLITALGAALGFVVSVLSIIVLRYITLPKWLGFPVVSLSTIMVTTLLLILTGLIAGYFPARQAAKLTPIAALRGL